MRTLQEFLKFDCGLKIGRTPVTMERRDGSRYPALIEIGPRGSVHLLPAPTESDMYTSWRKITGDTMKVERTIVWGARDPTLMREFENPQAVIRMNDWRKA